MTRTVDFHGRTAVITGGASGIGRGIAEAFVARGSNVVLADLDNDALQATAAELGVLGVHTDVTKADSVQALADRAVAEYGSVHVVCNNAGVGPMGAVADLTLEDWRWMIDVNLFGVIHGVHAFLPILERNDDWGHIVNTSSMSVLAPPANLAPYVASKAGVFGLTEVLAQELQQSGSRVGATLLIPGPVHTNIKNSLRSRPQNESGSLADVDLSAKRTSFRFLEAAEVGVMVLGAISNDELYAATHEEWLPEVGQRQERIREGFPAYAPAAP